MKIIPIAFMFLLSMSLTAQTSDFIRSGRPGNASGPYAAGKHLFQLENGTFYYAGEGNRSLVGNSLYLRYGIFERFEVNLITDLTKYSADSNIAYGGPNLGLKMNWMDGFKKLSFGTILSYDFSNVVNEGGSTITLNNIFGYQITDKTSLCLNAKLMYNSETERRSGLLIFNAGRSIFGQHNFIYGEVSAYLQDDPRFYFRAGFFKQFTKNLQVDVSLRLDQVRPDNHLAYLPGGSVGFAYRFKG